MRHIVRDVGKRFGLVTRSLGIILSAARGWTLAWATLAVVSGLVPAGIVYVTKWLTDSVVAAVSAGLSREAVMIVLYPALTMGLLLLLQQAFVYLAAWIQIVQGELVQDRIKTLIHTKAAAVDYSFYESSEYFDKLQQANSEASTRTLSILENLGGLLQNSITFVSVSVILATYAWWLPFVLVAGVLPALIVIVRQNREYHEWWRSVTSTRRRAAYFDTVLVSEFSAAELRVFGLGPFVMQQYRNLRDRLRGERIEMARRHMGTTLLATMQAVVVTGGAMAWMLWRAMQGFATLGDIALFYQAVNQGQTLARSLFRNAGQVFAGTLFLEHLFGFLEIESRVSDPPAVLPFPREVNGGVLFDRVTFAYPGTDVAVLENFSLHLPAGKIVAIVGANGAGKSTLTKLLCRLYDPDSGSVRLDGLDIRRFRLEEFREQVSILFQTPVRYQTTARENITLGRDYPPESVRDAALAAGADEFIEKLPLRYENILGRMFAGGAELSGGQWQRITLSRAYLRPTPILILDEPTSFMDSWAEVEWLGRFRQLAAGRIALIITHRFTTAMQADIIHVMEEGQITESGSHDELVARGGRYAESWAAQIRQSGSPVLPNGSLA